MISLEKARLSLELVVQVRNKVLEAYQNMMQMQI
jgi:flagellar hook-basal body complex protein FliE